MDFRVLGPVEVASGDRPVDLHGEKRTAILAFLLCRAGVTVSTDRLLHEIWGTSSVGLTSTLHSHISRLRRAFGTDAGVIQSRSPGYLFHLRPEDQLDSVRFETLAAEGRRRLAAGELDRACAALDDALALWRGEPYAQLSRYNFAEREADRLNEVRGSAIEDRFEVRLARGEHSSVIPDLCDQVSECPQRERLAGQLMLAFYRSGRQGEALGVYQQTRQHLVEALGIEPTKWLQELENDILVQRPHLDWPVPSRQPDRAHRADSPVEPLRSDPQPAPGPEAPRPQEPDAPGRVSLPVQLTPFVGRARELDELQAQIAGSRLVTITGCGGCGKTRLAMQVAAAMKDAFAGGVYFVDLASVTTAEMVPGAVAAAIGMIDNTSGTLAPVCEALGAGRVLLVLDNCEHLLDASGEAVEALLASCPNVKILATSREELGVRGGGVWMVRPLTVPPPMHQLASPVDGLRYEAVQLFMDRARARKPDIDNDSDTVRLVAAICCQLDGIPLAIELAAGLVGSMSLTAISQRLDKRFNLLRSGGRIVPRQRTLRAAIEWSHGLLDEEEKLLFARLAVFRGELTVEAVAAVCDCDDEVALDGVLALLRKCVVAAVDSNHGPTAYRLLETMREFAAEQLVRLPDHRETRVRHARYYAAWSEEFIREVHGPDGQSWLARADREQANFRAALSWAFGEGEFEVGARLLGGLRWYVGRLLDLDESRRWLDTTMARRQELPPDLELRLLMARTNIGFVQGDQLDHGRFGEEAVALAERIGDDQLLASALVIRGSAAVYEGKLERANECFERASLLFEQRHDQFGRGWMLSSWATSSRRSGDLDRCVEQASEAVRIFQDLSDRHGQVVPLVNLAQVFQQRGHLDAAAQQAEEAVRLARFSGRAMLQVALCTLGRIELDRDRESTARPLLLQTLTDFAGHDHVLMSAIALEGLAILAARVGNDEDAVRLWAFSDEYRQRLALPMSAPRVQERTARLDRLQDGLGLERFERADRQGRGMLMPEARRLAARATEGFDLDRRAVEPARQTT